MKDFTYRQVGDSVFLTFFGEITCKRVESFREVLSMSANAADRVVIDFSRVSRLDPRCLQSICKALRNIRELNKKIVLIGQYGEVFRKAEIEAGCIMDSGCVLC